MGRLLSIRPRKIFSRVKLINILLLILLFSPQYPVCAISQTIIRSPMPIWFYPSTWYPYVIVNGVPTPGQGEDWKPGYMLQGDYNAMFAPGAPWDPSNVAVLVLNMSDIKGNPKAEFIAEWSRSHPNVKLGLVIGMMTVGPDSRCVSGGGQAFPPKGTPLTRSQEGVEYHQNYVQPGWNYSQQTMNAINAWEGLRGRPLDIMLMDTPLSAGIGKCGFSVPQAVSFMVPMAKQILAVFPKIRFSMEQGPTSWTDKEFINYSLQFFREFRKQIGVPVSYANLDLHLNGDIRKPPTPLYTMDGVTGTINKVVKAFNAAGVGVGVNINATPRNSETQAQVVARLHGYLEQALSSRLPFDHISIQPFAVAHHYNWVMYNLPDTSPSALTWLLQHP